MRVLARHLEKLEARLTRSTLEPVDRLLSQVNAALTAREKVLIGKADELNRKGGRARSIRTIALRSNVETLSFLSSSTKDTSLIRNSKR